MTLSLNDLRLRNCYIRYLHLNSNILLSNILLLFTWPWAAKRLVEGAFCTLSFLVALNIIKCMFVFDEYVHLPCNSLLKQYFCAMLCVYAFKQLLGENEIDYHLSALEILYF